MAAAAGAGPDAAAAAPERTLVVWCPDWPLTAAGVGHDEAAAVVVANRVVASSLAAWHDGVVRGLRRREAQGRCPSLRVLAADPAQEARAFEPVVAAVESFAPRVEVTRPGQCALATRGPSRYFGGDEALARAIADRVRAVAWCDATAAPEPGVSTGADAAGCVGDSAVAAPGVGAAMPVRVGVADGAFAATLAARATTDDEPVRVVAPGTTAAFLAPFPIGALNRPELADLLTRLGIRTLGDFAALPAADVLARFGVDGSHAHRLARGVDERPLSSRRPPPELAVQCELDPPANRVDIAAFAAKGLAEELHHRLSSRGLACTRVLVEAETEHGERLARLWRHDGALTAAAMAERVRWQLDGWLAGAAPGRGGADADVDGIVDVTAGLTLLRLVPDEVKADNGRALGFWGGVADADERAARALARLQGMLGPDAVTTGVLSGGRNPDEHVHLVRWGDPREPARPGAPGGAPVRADGRVEVPPWPGRLQPPAPATVHRPATPAELVDAAGEQVAVTGRGMVPTEPARLRVDGGVWVDVVAWAGPWPVDERWWDPASHRRRARFQVALHTGAAHLVTVEGGRWWVEASYD
ncbi:MAG: DNA polymerase Y family protein [Actinobacteria bacterium]|nr:DNA polymerase Y family protein [Actinomycetota bacterium]